MRRSRYSAMAVSCVTFLYVDDLVRCLLMVAVTDRAYGQVFNVGPASPCRFRTSLRLCKGVRERAE